MYRKKPVRLPSNQVIASAIILRYHQRIVGAAYKFGVRYHLQEADREELVGHVQDKILHMKDKHKRDVLRDWRTTFRKNLHWVRENYPNHRPTWTAEEIAKVMNGYVYTLIRKSMLDYVRSIKTAGISGMGLHPLDSIEVHEGWDYRDDDDNDWETSEPTIDGQANRIAARQIAFIAQNTLSGEEWLICQLTFGFDGGGTRTPTQVAREAQMPRKQVQQLLEAALNKMRSKVESK